MKSRYGVLALLVLLSAITYLDRICIAVAGPRMQAELGIVPERWGWVLGAFALGYGFFEIPSGAFGDRFGQRKVLARIVVWWSAFTSLTGLVSSYPLLVLTRFLFGAGEAGAYPNASGSISRWFPAGERARAQGFVWAASRVGGALTPLLVVPLMATIGWRAVFLLFGCLGLVWAAAWYGLYRDYPPGRQPAGGGAHPPAPWRRLFSQPQLWLLMATYWFYAWGSSFYLSWFPQYLVKGRGFTEAEMSVAAALPFVLGATGNLVGGFLGDRLSQRYGLRSGRRLLGSVCLVVAASFILATALTPGKVAGVILLAVGYGVMDCMLPSAWATCVDLGGRYVGAVSGAMNTAGQAGGFTCTVLFGHLVGRHGDYSTPLMVIAVMVMISAVLFSRLDPSRPLLGEDAA